MARSLNLIRTYVQVDEYNSIRLKLTAEMADNSNLVKNLVIKVWVGDVLYVFVLCVCVWVSCICTMPTQ